MEMTKLVVFAAAAYFVATLSLGECNQMKELYDSLIGYKSTYNKLSRPVFTPKDKLWINIDIKLMGIADLNEKNQIMTSSFWIHQEWNDSSLRWRPEDYGGIKNIKIPADMIWKPDMVIYNNAEGSYEITILTHVKVHSTGLVEWDAPTVYYSSCDIAMEYFPFDEQECFMKLGSWTYDAFQLDYNHIRFPLNGTEPGKIIEDAIDLSEYSSSGAWDLMKTHARKTYFFYPCCPEPYPDITYYITIRRKTLFYAVNLIIPCIGIALLTSLVFYLPTDGGERVGLGINILLALMVFLVLLADNTPPTSIAIPLITRYLVLVMLLCTLALCLTIFTCNLHLRSGDSYTLPKWMRFLFIKFFPKYLGIKARSDDDDDEAEEDPSAANKATAPSSPVISGPTYPALLEGILEDITYVANDYREIGQSGDDASDWQYVAMVMDRLFFILFTLVGLLSTIVLFTNIPTLWDYAKPIG